MSESPKKATPDQPKRPFPVLPRSKVLALCRFTSPPTPEQLKTIFPKEVPDTLRLYLSGDIEQMLSRQDRKGPVFLMNVKSAEEAHTILEKLPQARPNSWNSTMWSLRH